MPCQFPRRSAPGLAVLLIVLAIGSCGGCASGPNKADPYEKTNRFIYNVNEGIDRVALKPAADVYTTVIPKPIRTGIGNGFDNLVYFNVILNDLLQGRWNQALSDIGRMAINSTIGIAGIFDWATPMGLPAHQNDFGVTLGKWGVKPGPYLVLPLFGPSDARDVSGLVVEYFATPTTYLCLPAKIYVPLDATELIDTRSRSDFIVRFRNDTALDPYIFTRDAYLQYREGRIKEGAPPTTGPAEPQSIYDQDMDAGPATVPAAAQPTPLPLKTYDGYFVSNKFEPNAAESYLVITDQKTFDSVFGAGYVMRDQHHRLPKGVFDGNIVIAAVKRGHATWDFKAMNARAQDGILTLSYTSNATASPTATFACPLIVSVPKGNYVAVKFVDNDKVVKQVALSRAAQMQP